MPQGIPKNSLGSLKGNPQISFRVAGGHICKFAEMGASWMCENYADSSRVWTFSSMDGFCIYQIPRFPVKQPSGKPPSRNSMLILSALEKLRSSARGGTRHFMRVNTPHFWLVFLGILPPEASKQFRQDKN